MPEETRYHRTGSRRSSKDTSGNSSREKSPDDRWTQQAKTEDVYWLCECGIARLDANKMLDHLEEEDHYAERVNTKTGRVLAFLAAGLDNRKYGDQIPGTAQIKREKLKNDPLFER